MITFFAAVGVIVIIALLVIGAYTYFKNTIPKDIDK